MGADVYKGSWDADDDDYFRDSYNDSSILARCGLSWWRDVVPLHDADGVMAVGNVIAFRDMVRAHPPRPVSAKEAKSWADEHAITLARRPELAAIIGDPLTADYYTTKYARLSPLLLTLTMTQRPKYADQTGAQLVHDVESLLTRYVVFQGPEYPFALALWVIATYLWQTFDAFAYLCITSATMRSGKTRLSELLSFVCSNPRNFASATAASIFFVIKKEAPTIFMDESERQSSESADVMREILNAGYRKGQTVPRMSDKGLLEWPVYCPKVFVLIGDVRATLRDRAIVVQLTRGRPAARFLYETAKNEGQLLRERIAAYAADRLPAVQKRYMDMAPLDFLRDRDEEIWTPLFVLCGILCPERMEELTRVAVDLSTDKTAPAQKHSELEMSQAERQATDAEYAERLLRDLLTVCGNRRSIATEDALKALHARPEMPWRRFRSSRVAALRKPDAHDGRKYDETTGLNHMDLSHLLKRFDVRPDHIRETSKGDGKRGQVRRGYYRADLIKAAQKYLGEGAV